jgi:SAM-dependent methyltransferase
LTPAHVPTELDPQDFWERRLEGRFTLAGTGYEGLGEGFNRWSYRVQRHVFNRTVKPLLDQDDPRVLDIGSGTGFYVERWRELGVRAVTGSDITSKSVTSLASRFPDHRFVQLDIGGDDLPFENERFDFVSAIAVLYHIVDDDSYARAFRNTFSLLQPGGFLVFSDNFVRDRPYRGTQQAVRLGTDIENTVRDAGFESLERRPMFVLTNHPVNSDSRLLHGWWTMLEHLLRLSETAGTIAGALLIPFELACVDLARRGPSLELAVCRKPAG